MAAQNKDFKVKNGLQVGGPTNIVNYSSSSPTNPFIGQLWVDILGDFPEPTPEEYLLLTAASSLYLSIVDAQNIYLPISASSTFASGDYDPIGSASAAEFNAKAYADSLASNYDSIGSASAAEFNAKSYADSLAPNYDAVGSASAAQSAAESYADSLAVNYDPVGSASAAEANANAYTASAIAALVDSAPTTLDTLNELAAALGDDANFAASTASAIGNKQPLDADLTAIAALSGTNGLLKKTATDTWTLDTTAYTTNTGTVTSVSVTVPTGLSVSGTPVTTSGTIAISLASGYTIPTTTTLDGKADKSGKLSQFSATTSSELAGVISDETGSGALVFATSPSLTTPNIGSASGTSLSLTGSLIAASKSFDISHPTKENMRLRYGSLEGPEAGVYVRGKSNSLTIPLPDYWTGLVDEDSITVQLTPIGKHKNLYVKDISNNTVTIGGCRGDFEFFYFIQAERKDIDKLVVEYGS